MMICNKNGTPKCPNPTCARGKPHRRIDRCAEPEWCLGDDGHWIGVRCVEVKEVHDEG